MENKRGQNLTLGTIILIVLGVAVLVLLIFGFSQGWNNLWGKVTSFFGGGNNVDTIIQSCTLACTTESEYDYCTLGRVVRLDDKKLPAQSCMELATNTTDGVNVDSCPALAEACKSCQLKTTWTSSKTKADEIAKETQEVEENCKLQSKENCGITVDYCEWR